ncbi:MAG: hypothetical protein OEY47_01290 [Candidatus Bathyarchaeota archaeon]|nr:hypothetical protein [Candidatus Bathyarchaeota archaeon]
MVKADRTLKVTLGIQKRIERLKRGEFKRKFKTKSVNDVIVKLLDIYDEWVILKEAQQGIVETGRIAEKSMKDEPKTREEWLSQRRAEMEEETLPDICPDCERFARCTRSSIRHPDEVKEEGCFIPRVRCVFRSVRPDNMIDCAKDFSKSGRIHKVTSPFCDKCWQRKTFIQKKIAKDQEEYPRIQCSLLDTTIKIENEKDFLKLPCVLNSMKKCPNEDCEKNVQKIMEEWKRRK